MTAQVLGKQLLVAVAAEEHERDAVCAQMLRERHDAGAIQIDVEHGDVHPRGGECLECALQARHDGRDRAAVAVDEESERVGDHEVVLDDEDAGPHERQHVHADPGGMGISISQRIPSARNCRLTAPSVS